MKRIYIIWLIFGFIFSTLGYYHYKASITPYPKFVFKNIKEPRPASFINSTAIKNEQKINLFVEGFNSYIDDYNENNRSSNLKAFWGYLVSAAIACISAYFEKHQIKKDFQSLQQTATKLYEKIYRWITFTKKREQ